MKTQRIIIPFFSLLFIALSFTLINCGDSEVKGCTFAFGTNYDSEATVDCCCEYEVEALVDDLVGAYDIKIDNSDFTNGFSYNDLRIIRDPNNSQGIIIKDYLQGEIFGTFENGKFKLETEIREALGCKRRLTGDLVNDNNTLKLDVEYRGWGISEPPKLTPCNNTNFTSRGELIKK